MNGATNGTASADVGQNPEDLDSVLSRFQKWNGPPPSTSDSPAKVGRAEPAKKVNPEVGSREPSYEQALRATSYRRQEYQTSAPEAPGQEPDPLAANSAAKVSEPDPTATAGDLDANLASAKPSPTSSGKASNDARPRVGHPAPIAAPPLVKPAAVSPTTAMRSELHLNTPASPSTIPGRKKAGKAGVKTASASGAATPLRVEMPLVTPISSSTTARRNGTGKVAVKTAAAGATRPERSRMTASSSPITRRNAPSRAGGRKTSAVASATTSPRKKMALGISPSSTAIARRKTAGKAGPKPAARTAIRSRSTPHSSRKPVAAAKIAAKPVKLQNPAPPRSSVIAKPAPAQRALPPPAFQEVLQRSAGLAATGKDGGTNKTIALSLRVSDAEQACIQACAARANVTVSAYLRQCALAVGGSTDEVEFALGELRKQDALRTPPPAISAIPLILRHAAADWFRSLLKKRENPGISLHQAQGQLEH